MAQDAALQSVADSGGAASLPVARLWLRLEAAGLLCAALALYAAYGLGWGVFALGFFAPDLAMLGYLAGPRVGALAYNLAHTTLGPLALTGLGWAAESRGLVAAGLIWAAHVGADRMLGYGLKSPEGFGITHLGRIGRPKAGTPES